MLSAAVGRLLQDKHGLADDESLRCELEVGVVVVPDH